MKIQSSNVFFASTLGIVATGAFIGIIAIALQLLGNPGNMGVCVACFERDIAGALGLHQAAVVQYMRPEILGMGLGAFAAALWSKDYRARAAVRKIEQERSAQDKKNARLARLRSESRARALLNLVPETKLDAITKSKHWHSISANQLTLVGFDLHGAVIEVTRPKGPFWLYLELLI